MIPSGCGIGRAPDGSVQMHGSSDDLAAWWFRDMKGREIGGHTVVSLCGQNESGVWWDDERRSTGLRLWSDVHCDLGDAFLRAGRS